MKHFTLLQEVLINIAQQFPEKCALCIGKNHYSYQYILTESRKLASLIQQNGFKRGDRIVIQTGNSLYTVIAFWATLIADGVASIIASDLNDAMINYILKDSGASVLLVDKISNDLYDYIKQSGDLQQIYVIKQDKSDFHSDKVHPFNFDTHKNHLSFHYKNNELDLASIIYTSGSTGEPKGVMLTHRNMLTALFSLNQYLEHTHKDIFLSALPLAFDYGLYQMLMAFSIGATLILEADAFFPALLLRKIQTEKVTVLPAVPTLFNLFVEHAKYCNYDYSSLRAITNTGASLSEKLIKQVIALFPNTAFFSMYGLTECKRCTYLPPDAIYTKPTSVGFAIPNTELWIIDDSEKKIGPGQIGQLVIRGATVMKGYWNKPDETEKKLKIDPITGDKVLYTGDYAMMDEEGYLYFKGRMDEMIKHKGMKVSPIEMENSISQLPEIKEVAVIGIQNEIEDVILIVCIVPTSTSVDEKILKTKIRKLLTHAQQPKQIITIENLPKNSNGKINKLELKNSVIKILNTSSVI